MNKSLPGSKTIRRVHIIPVRSHNEYLTNGDEIGFVTRVYFDKKAGREFSGERLKILQLYSVVETALNGDVVKSKMADVEIIDAGSRAVTDASVGTQMRLYGEIENYTRIAGKRTWEDLKVSILERGHE